MPKARDELLTHFRHPEPNYHPVFINSNIRVTHLWPVYIVISSTENRPRTVPTTLFFIWMVLINLSEWKENYGNLREKLFLIYSIQ